jgi:prophage tail gpP-like protein
MKIKIDGRNYSFFDELKISFKLDSMASVFSFKGRFNPSNLEQRKIFKPLGYLDVDILDNDNNLLLKGTLLNTLLNSDSERKLQSLSGYSKSGIIEDCAIPFSSYPLEKNNMNLDDIVSSLLRPFDINYIVDDSALVLMNQNYSKTVAEPSESIGSFIKKLAAQRNIIITHTNDGSLLFYKPDLKAGSKAFFNKENTISMSLSVSGQSMHSEITVIRQPSKDNPGLEAVDTIQNNLVKKNRSLVKTLSNGTETDTKKAADNVLASQLRSIAIKIELNKIIHDIKCGDLVEVQNDEIYLFKRCLLVVKEIDITENSSSEIMSINLVLPETFTGENPKNIFET